MIKSAVEHANSGGFGRKPRVVRCLCCTVLLQYPRPRPMGARGRAAVPPEKAVVGMALSICSEGGEAADALGQSGRGGGVVLKSSIGSD